MAKSTEKKKTESSPGKKVSRVSSGKRSLPLWALVMIMIVVFVGVYLLIENTDKKEPAMSNLPLEISVEEAAKLDQEDWYFLDVREPSEWEEAHIPYATLIPLGELESRLSEIPKNKNIIVVCRSGNRSAVGRDLLLNSSFTSVTSMAGGMNSWQANGDPVVTGP